MIIARSSRLLVGVALLAACASQSQPENGNKEAAGSGTNADTPGASGLSRADVEAAAKKALLDVSPAANVAVSSADVAGVVIVRARIVDAPPQTGVASIVYDPHAKASYGARGQKPLAALFVARDWFAKPPSGQDVARIAHEAFFDGLLILKEPVVDFSAAAIQVVLVAHDMGGDELETHVVTINADGTQSAAIR